VGSKEFFKSGQHKITVMAFLETWGHLEVVVECVVSPKHFILNDLMTYAHMNGSKPTSMSLKFILRGGREEGDNP